MHSLLTTALLLIYSLWWCSPGSPRMQGVVQLLQTSKNKNGCWPPSNCFTENALLLKGICTHCPILLFQLWLGMGVAAQFSLELELEWVLTATTQFHWERVLCLDVSTQFIVWWWWLPNSYENHRPPPSSLLPVPFSIVLGLGPRSNCSRTSSTNSVLTPVWFLLLLCTHSGVVWWFSSSHHGTVGCG